MKLERLVEIRELVNNNRLFMPPATILERIAIDGDDFVEECAWLMAPEIGNLLGCLNYIL